MRPAINKTFRRRKKHTCGQEQLEVLRRRLETFKEAIQNDNSLTIAHAKTAPSEATHTKFLVPTWAPPSSKMEEETANMEPFSTTPIFYFSVEEMWDGMSETSLVHKGQRIPVDLTLAENNELEEGH
jgi:hypothetical protein